MWYTVRRLGGHLVYPVAVQHTQGGHGFAHATLRDGLLALPNLEPANTRGLGLAVVDPWGPQGGVQPSRESVTPHRLTTVAAVTPHPPPPPFPAFPDASAQPCLSSLLLSDTLAARQAGNELAWVSVDPRKCGAKKHNCEQNFGRRLFCQQLVLVLKFARGEGSSQGCKSPGHFMAN